MAARRAFGAMDAEETGARSPSVVDIAVAAAAAAEAVVEQSSPPKVTSPSKVTSEHEGVDRAEAAEGSKNRSPDEPDVEDRPSKRSHLDFGISLVMERSFEGYRKKGYLTQPQRCRAGGSDTTPDPRRGEIVLFECFFNSGLRLPMNSFVPMVLQRFGIFFHQLTPNAIARMSAFCWALASQGVDVDVEAFVQTHELHYQTKKDPETGLHPNFGCYSFRTRSGTEGPCTAYKSKWSNGWNQRWFYYHTGKSFQEDHKGAIMASPLDLNFGLTRPKLKPSEMTKRDLQVMTTGLEAYKSVCSEVYMRDIIEEFVAYGVRPLQAIVKMPVADPKPPHTELVRLPYLFKTYHPKLDGPTSAWRKRVDEETKDIVGNFTVSDSKKLFAAFPHREKKRLNRVFDAFGVSYSDYINLEKEKKKQEDEEKDDDEEIEETVTRRTPKVRVKRAARKKTRAAPAPSADEGDEARSSPSAEKTAEATPVRRGVKRTAERTSKTSTGSSPKASHPSEPRDDNDQPLRASPTLRQSLSHSQASSPSKKKAEKTSSDSDSVYIPSFKHLTGLDTTGADDVQEATSERTPAKHDEEGDSSSTEHEAAEKTPIVSPLADFDTPGGAEKTTQGTEGNSPRDPELTPKPQRRAIPSVSTPVNRRPGKEPAGPVDTTLCDWKISDAYLDLNQMVSDSLVFSDLEEKVANFKPWDLLVHSGVHLTKVTSFELG